MPEQAEKARALPSGGDPEGPVADLKPQSYTWRETESPNSQPWTLSYPSTQPPLEPLGSGPLVLLFSSQKQHPSCSLARLLI